MSSEFNNMEHMFADGLRDYEVTPPAHIWGNIQKRKRKGLLYYSWRIAAALLLLFMAGGTAYYFATKNNEAGNTIVVTKTAKASSKNEESKVVEEKTMKDKNPDISKSVKSNDNSSSTPEYSTPKSTAGKIKKQDIQLEIAKPENEIPAEETNVYYIEDLLLNIGSKDDIQFRYLIYPSLMQYVYTSKRLFKKYYTPKTKEDDEKLGYKYSVELPLMGASYAFRKLSGDGSLLRNESENALFSLQTGIKLNYHFNSKWSVQTGLIVENRNEKIKYDRTEIQDKLTQTARYVTVYHPVLPPKTIEVIDSSYSKENVNYKFNSTNKYTTLSIPVVFGYNFSLGGKAIYRLSAGTLFNIYSMNSANNLVRTGDKIELVPYRESSKIKTSVYTAVAFIYPVSNQYELFSELSCYNNLSNRLNSDAAIRQRNYGFNLSGGLKINILK